MSEAPDVAASSLTRRVSGELPPDVARLRYVHVVKAGPEAACQVCNVRDHGNLIVFEPIVDRGNGQRITVALCLLCVVRGVAAFEVPPPPPKRRKRGGRP